MLQSVGGTQQFVSSTEVVWFSECPLSEVPLYIHCTSTVCCIFTCNTCYNVSIQ